MTEDPRLARIESKVDELSKAFVILARTEEKLIIIERDRVDMKERIQRLETASNDGLLRLENTIREMNSKVHSSSQVTTSIMRIFWLLVSGITGAFAITAFSKL